MDTKQLKLKILDLAIKGKLCPQNPKDEPASELIKRIREEKAKLVKEKKIKASKTDSYIYRKADGSFYERIGKTETCIDKEIPFEIPSSWEWVRLGSICNNLAARTEQSVDILSDAWILDLEDIEKDSGVLCSRMRKKDMEFEGIRKFFVKGNILYSKLRPYLNKVLVADMDGYCTTEIIPLDVNVEIFPGYVKFFLMSQWFVSYANARSYGSKMPRLGTKDLYCVLLPIPPLFELNLITRTIEKLFLYASTIKSNNQKLQQNMAAARTKLLDLAIQGKLVQQNPEDEPTSKLLEKIQAEKQDLIKSGKLKPSKFESTIYQKEDGSYYERIGKTEKCIDEDIPFPIPPNWAWVRLGSLVSLTSGKTLTRKMMENHTQYPVYGGNGISGYFNDYFIEQETLIIGRVGFYCGNTHIIKKYSWVTDNALIVKVCDGFLSLPWLKHYLDSLNLGRQSSSTAQPVITGKTIYPNLVALPPLGEQIRIVAKIKELYSFV